MSDLNEFEHPLDVVTLAIAALLGATDEQLRAGAEAMREIRAGGGGPR
ncbi:hypothetical protein ACIBHY_16960 [Nonomuraea sp. NPDC050547]